MSLIDCPECGSRVSNQAPTCPHCGVPIAAAATTAAPAASVAEKGSAPGTETQQEHDVVLEEDLTPQVQEVEAWKPKLAGRPIPIAFLLFWGGMIFGVVQNFVFPNPALRSVAFYMIFAGVLWFAVTEFIALVRSRRLRRTS